MYSPNGRQDLNSHSHYEKAFPFLKLVSSGVFHNLKITFLKFTSQEVWIHFKILISLFVLITSGILFIPIFFVALLVRSVVWLLARVYRPDLDTFVMRENSLFALEGTSKATLNILCTMVGSRQVRTEDIAKDFEERVYRLRDPGSGERLYKRLEYTWEGYLGYSFWKRDTNFNLRNHIRDYDYGGGELALPQKVTTADLHQILQGLVEAPWDRRRSPWENLTISNYYGDGETPTTATIFRIDHVLADGYSILDLVKKLTGSPFTIPKFKLGERRFTFWEKVGLAGKVPWDFAKNVGLVFGSKTLRYQKKYSPDGVILSVSPSISVSVIKDIRNHYGVNYATVVYAAIFGAIARAVKESGMEVPPTVAAAFILPKLGHPNGLSVHATGTLTEWPMTGSTTERLARIQNNFQYLSKSTSALAYPLVSDIAGFFPMLARRILTNFFIDLGISICFSNFPVTTGTDYYGDCEITDLTITLGNWSTLGMFVISGGLNNKQKFCFSVNKSIFASAEAAKNLGPYVVQELEALRNGIKKLS